MKSSVTAFSSDLPKNIKLLVRQGALIFTCKTHRQIKLLWGELAFGTCAAMRSLKPGCSAPWRHSFFSNVAERGDTGERGCFHWRRHSVSIEGRNSCPLWEHSLPVSTVFAWELPRQATHSRCPSASCRGSLLEPNLQHNICNNVTGKFALIDAG